MENLERLLRYIVTELVENKAEIKISKYEKEKSITLKVRVAEGELGRLIGKNGLTANAIRNVVYAAAIKDNIEVDIQFLD